MTPEEKTKERIAKLLAFASGNHNSEEEAANAMRMAAGLAAKIGIDLEALRPKDAPIPKAVLKHSHTTLKVYESYCAEAAAVLYGCECNAPNYGKNGYWFVGREDNIELSEQTMLWLIQQVEALYKQALPRGLSKRDRAEFRGSFKDACGRRIYERSLTVMREMKTNEAAAQAATGQNALVVQDYFKQLQSEVNQYWDDRAAASRKSVEDYQQRRLEARNNRLAAMTEPERIKFLADEIEQKEKDRKAAEKAARKAASRPYKEPRGRSMKVGSGTGAGREAGDRVQLRKEIGS